MTLLFVISTAHAREPSVCVYNQTTDRVEYQRNVLVVQYEKQRRVIVVLGERNKSRRTDTVQDIMYNHVLDQNLQDPKYINN